MERGYGSAKSLYEQAKEEGAVITLEEVKNFMKKQSNKQIKGYQNYNSYLVPYAKAEFQTDIVDMNKFKQEGEERYGLIVSDAFSRYAYRALKATFKVMGEPIEIFSDEDTAFLSVVKKYLDGLGIVQKTTRTHANIVERLIRTIKNGVANRICFTKGNWTDLYKPTLKKYNKQYTLINWS